MSVQSTTHANDRFDIRLNNDFDVKLYSIELRLHRPAQSLMKTAMAVVPFLLFYDLSQNKMCSIIYVDIFARVLFIVC
jgi:hypothetical protein